MEEISLLELLEALKRRFALIIILTILGGAIAFGVSSILPKQYETFTTMLLGRPEGYETNQNNIQVNDILVNQKLVGTYGELIKSRSVSERVIDELGLDMTYETFR